MDSKPIPFPLPQILLLSSPPQKHRIRKPHECNTAPSYKFTKELSCSSVYTPPQNIIKKKQLQKANGAFAFRIPSQSPRQTKYYKKVTRAIEKARAM